MVLLLLIIYFNASVSLKSLHIKSLEAESTVDTYVDMLVRIQRSRDVSFEGVQMTTLPTFYWDLFGEASPYLICPPHPQFHKLYVYMLSFFSQIRHWVSNYVNDCRLVSSTTGGAMVSIIQMEKNCVGFQILYSSILSPVLLKSRGLL